MLSKMLNIIAKKKQIRSFFWGFFSLGLFFSALVLILTQNFFPLYFPCLLLCFLSLIFFLRTIGLYVSVLGLSPFYYWAFQEKAIFELALLYSCALVFFTIFLCIEEWEINYHFSSAQGKPHDQSKEDREHLVQWENQKKEFQKTIEDLKEQAERRYLEYSSLKENHEMLEAKYQLFQIEKEKNQKEKEALLEKIEEEKGKYLHEISEWKEKYNIPQLLIESLQNDLLKARSTYEAQCQENQALADEILKLLEEIAQYKKEITIISERWQEEKLKCQALEEPLKNKDSLQEKNREFAHVLGKYNQLREQFEEKAKVLSQTRKELFQTQSKLMVMEKAEQMKLLEGHSEDALLAQYEEEIEILESEIREWEMLIRKLLV